MPLISVLVAILIIAFVAFAVRFIRGLPVTTITKAWAGIGLAFATIGVFVVLTTIYARLDLPFHGKLFAYTITRYSNPFGHGPTMVGMDTVVRGDQLEVFKIANNRQAAYVTVFREDGMHVGQLQDDRITFLSDGFTPVGGLWWLYTNRSAYEISTEVN